MYLIKMNEIVIGKEVLNIEWVRKYEASGFTVEKIQ